MQISLSVVGTSGQAREITAEDGWTLMEALTSAGVAGVLAECGGACSCATCHVYVGGEPAGRLGAVSDAEEAMLEFALERRANSRLACQIELTADLAGLEVVVPEDQL